ncbi:hypothetical protein C2845_PM12G19650 [Panicum miliaceum]|uniref:Uncharacterized protein n=1 Tax=Panicum miliaceum TaxID=4540 RepID=A0A3L6QGE1_PANMI|nr:hypothetical protein C2845_PM12G19650 [Panicum miliaceum]
MARPLGCGGPGAVSCPGYPSSKARGSGGGAEAHHPSTASASASGGGGRKMKPSQLNFTRPPQQEGGGAGGHLSQISEDGAFPAGLVGADRGGASSGGGAAPAFSGGFSIVGPWEESRDIIATLGAYDSQALKHEQEKCTCCRKR